MKVDDEKIAHVIREVAEAKIVPRFDALEDGHVRSKTSPGDLVTIADEEAEIELTRIFKDLFPGCYVVGEEAVSSGTVARDILKDSDAMIWVVDPVDGTHNFAHSIPRFGTMVSLIERGERTASWIYQIPRERMISARRGEGVQIDSASFTSPARAPADGDLAQVKAFISRKFMPPPMRPSLDQSVKKLADASTHFCCAWEYIEVLEGLSTFSIYSRVEPWDHHAGVLILEEAGYYVRQWDGSAYTPADFQGGIINAPSEAWWRRIHEEFMEDALRHFPVGRV